MRVSTPGGLVGRGIYDVVEVARLIHRDPATVARWTSGPKGQAFLVAELGKGLFSFHDLVSLHVISELLGRGVKRADIRRGGEYIAEVVSTSRPFAHERLATVGDDFFASVEDEWVDAGRRGQGAFQDVVSPLLRRIQFGNDGLARTWTPAPHVLINPTVQTGAPCIEGTRVPTSLIAQLVPDDIDADALDEQIIEIADDFILNVDQVKAAIAFEGQLAA